MPKKKPIQYDFREGILLEKVVYKDTSGHCKKNLLYILCLIITWVWGSAWFALFFYLYINYEPVMFWIFIVIWIILIYTIIVFGIINIQASKYNKNLKIEKQNMKKKIKIEIMKARMKRAKFRSRLNNRSESFDSSTLISKNKIENRDSFSVSSKVILNTEYKSRNNNQIKNIEEEEDIGTEDRLFKTE